MFSHNGANEQEPKMMHMFCQVRQVAALRAKLLSMITGLFRQNPSKGFS